VRSCTRRLPAHPLLRECQASVPKDLRRRWSGHLLAQVGGERGILLARILFAAAWCDRAREMGFGLEEGPGSPFRNRWSYHSGFFVGVHSRLWLA
jgi:hypothetical protein